MTGIIRAPRAHTHDQIPRAALRDSSLSYRARGILARLLTNADGYRMSAHDLAAEGREGRDAILSALRELRGAGYIAARKEQLANGRWITDTVVHETPQPAGVGKPDLGFPDPGSPDSGFSHPKSRDKSSSRKSSSKARAAVPAAAPDGKEPHQSGGASPPPELPQATAHTGRKRRRTHSGTGVVFWYDDEVAEIEALVQAHALAAVKQAAADLRSRGKDPLPSLVGAVLARQRATETAQRANGPKRHERTPEERAEDDRKATEAMAEYRRLLEEGEGS